MVELKQTVDAMCSSDYKERFKAEYFQLKIRIEKLTKFINRIEAAHASTKVREPEHDVPLGLLESQLHMMIEYLHVLEVRAIIENIDLNPDETIKE